MEPEHEKIYKLIQFNKTHWVIQELGGDNWVYLLTRPTKKIKNLRITSRKFKPHAFILQGEKADVCEGEMKEANKPTYILPLSQP